MRLARKLERMTIEQTEWIRLQEAIMEETCNCFAIIQDESRMIVERSRSLFFWRAPNALYAAIVIAIPSVRPSVTLVFHALTVQDIDK